MTQAQRIYSGLLRAYPRAFRRRYATLATEDFGLLHGAAVRRAGVRGAAILWLRTIPAVLRDGLSERRALPGGLPGRPTRPPRPTESRGWLAQTLQDVRYGYRSLALSPGFTCVAILTIAIGMAANSTIFGMTYALMYAELPYADDSSLAVLWTTYPERGNGFNATSVPDWSDIRARSSTLADVAFYEPLEINLTGGDEPLALTGYRVTTNTFELLGVDPAMGRGLLEDDGVPGADPVVVVSWRLWQRLGAPADMAGTYLTLNESDHAVAGIMPEDFDYPQMQVRGDLWVPARLRPEDVVEGRRRRGVIPIARIAPDKDIEAVNAELDAIMADLSADHVDSNTGVGARAVQLREQMSEPMKPALGVLLAAVGLVLTICCTNVAGLFLARSASRQGEIAVRKSLGASRLRIVRQLLTEALLVALAGGVAGYVLAEIGGRLLVASLPAFVFETSSTATQTDPEPRVMLLTFIVAACAGIAFGLVPALRASRFPLQGVLRAAPGFDPDARRGGRVRSLLLIAEVAFAVVLIASAGLMVKGFSALLSKDPGFDPDGVLTIELALNGPRYDDTAVRHDFYRRVADAIGSAPGVTASGAASILPLQFQNNTTSFVTEATAADEHMPVAGYRMVTPGYLEAMGARLIAGRLIDADDRADAAPVVVVNEALLRYLPEGNPIGQRMRDSADEEWSTIVGVIQAFQHDTLLTSPGPAYYTPYDQTGARRRMFVAIKSAGLPPAELAGAVRDAVWSVDPAIPVDAVQSLREIVDTSLIVVRLPTVLMAVFGGIAVILAAVGLYGMLSQSVARRTRELGIRVALGASRHAIVRLVVARAVIVSGIGLALGTAAAIPLGSLLASVLEGVSAWEPVIYTGVPGALLVVALVATLVPARRALAVDPAIALRTE